MMLQIQEKIIAVLPYIAIAKIILKVRKIITLLVVLTITNIMVLLMFVIAFIVYNDNYDASDSREDYRRPPLHSYRENHFEG